LALERQVVEILVDRDLDGERWRVAPAADVGLGGEAERARGRVDAAVARAAVLLPLMLHEDEAPFDDIDLFGVLGLALHLRQGPAALRTRAVGLGELVHDLERG
jgi:hypothetical protein